MVKEGAKCGMNIADLKPKGPLQEVDAVILLCPHPDAVLLERAVRNVVGGRLPLYGASLIEDWGFVAKGVALKQYNAKKERCDLQARRRWKREEQSSRYREEFLKLHEKPPHGGEL